MNCEASNLVGTKNARGLIAFMHSYSEESFRIETNQTLIRVGDAVAMDCVAVNSSFEIDLKWFLRDKQLIGKLNSMKTAYNRCIYLSCKISLWLIH